MEQRILRTRTVDGAEFVAIARKTDGIECAGSGKFGDFDRVRFNVETTKRAHLSLADGDGQCGDRLLEHGAGGRWRLQ